MFTTTTSLNVSSFNDLAFIIDKTTIKYLSPVLKQTDLKIASSRRSVS